MKPKSKQNARVGKTRKRLNMKKLNLSSLIDRIDGQPQIITDLKSS